jgi:alkylated DNA nucleotide flippase Atl1
MASTRADEVAEVLWELKRAQKISTYTAIARRAGFSPGSNGRALMTCLKTVRRDWPHLQWWRAVQDNGVVEADSEQAVKLKEAGFEIVAEGNSVTIKEFQSHIMTWDPVPSAST